MANERVSFVVATYDRPDTLLVALRSIQHQSEGGWQVLVIGDACSAETEAAVNGLADARMSYVNLVYHFGHQSGPNSVGSLLADTPLLAYLNHDDILLPDHLARARAALRGGADFFVGAALFAENDSDEAISSPAPLFLERSRPDMTASDAFGPVSRLFEPASAWVFERRLFERVGNWVHPRQTFRTPLQDFIMRMWRAGARFSFGDVPTVLKIVTFRGVEAGGTYAVKSLQHQTLADRLQGRSADEQRDIALGSIDPQPIERRRRRRDPLSRSIDRLLFDAAARRLYLETGIDSASVYHRFLRPRSLGKNHAKWVLRKTSRALPTAEGYESQVAEAVEAARRMIRR